MDNTYWSDEILERIVAWCDEHGWDELGFSSFQRVAEGGRR